MTEFLAMGGYAAFVWPAFAIAGVVMTVLWVASWRTLRAREAALEALQRARADAANSGDEA
ncbi:MAG: heme exporter protein CcmD [Proteobacteria bacterium]|nr:heme exporter protein CcmD [Pseudomonadota bacterium]